ncbi:hypothetical protein BDW22DRAFT_391777 [Trametopsis cervina]|nr:hypothetical protein BDW22DRAFT_391777 [Trametopsis cervina]
MSKFAPSPQEVALVNQIFTQTDSQKIGVVTGEAAVKVFGGSKLSPAVLAEIWNLADEDNKGVLTRKDVAVAIRLLGHAQRGERITEALIHKPGAPPSIEGLNAPLSGQLTGRSAARSPPPGPSSALPPLTPQDKTKFTKLFLGYGPQNGLLPGDKARDVFVKSKLPVDKLSQIWALADTKHRGSLDVVDFTIAMYLIQASMSNAIQTIPPVLPPSLYEQARGGPDAVVSHATGSSSSFSPSITGSFPGRPAVATHFTGQGILQQQYTGQGILQPQSTGQRPTPPVPPRSTGLSNLSNMSPFSVPPQAAAQQWDVTAAEKASADNFFDTLDPQKRGYIEGDVAVPFMLQSKLHDDVLAQIWDLSDLNNDGRLTRDGFAVAFHLIQTKLAGKDIPATLPSSLIPPSMRGSQSAVVSTPSQPPVPEAIKDLLWDDTPPPSAGPSAPLSIMAPQRTGPISPQHTAQPFQQPPSVFGGSDPFGGSGSPFATTSSPFTVAASAPATVVHKDLLGDDDEPPAAASPPLQDKSAEIGNAQNQLHSTNRALETVKQEREDLERRVAEQESQLSSLQAQLSSSKAAYETETHTLATLRERFSAQTVDIQKTRQELIHAESNLSAIREEKNDVSTSLLRDKDEVRELQRKMTEVGMEVEALKGEVEKAKKDAKQQKGLLAIAKKQLASREAERAKIAKELEEAQAEVSQAAKEREDAETELANAPEPVAPVPERVASPAESLTTFAATQPLPSSPEVHSPSLIASPASTKSTNPFERLALGAGSPRSESPFLPFAGSVLPTPPTGAPVAAPVAVPPSEPAQKDPFGFDTVFGNDEPAEDNRVEEEPKTAASAVLEDSPFSNQAYDQVPDHTEDTSLDIMSPTESDMFHTPPSTALPNTASTFSPPFTPTADASGDAYTFASAFPDITGPQETRKEEHTNLDAPLQELEVDESDSDTDSDDGEPLASVQSKLKDTVPANGAATSTSSSAFDDTFGASSSLTAVPATSAPHIEATATTDTTPKAPAAPFPAPDTVQQTASDGSPAGVSDFDEAMGLSGSGTSASQFSHVSQFTFDSAFDDDFDFVAAKAATTDPAASGTAPPAPAPANQSYFPQPTAGPSVTQSSTASPFTTVPSGFPPPPASAGRPKSDGFDAIFLPQATQNNSAPGTTAAPAPATSSQPVSFEDAFGASASVDTPVATSNPAASKNGPLGISFEDAFGGNTSNALALDDSFSSSSQHFAPPSSPPPGAKGTTPFPTSSIPSSPTADNYAASRRSLSPTPRTASPPPRPKSRPSTGTSEKEKDKVRHSKLSIRLPFGRKKAKPEPMPSQLSHSLLVEEPGNDATPAAEDDIEAVKTLCGMGFSRTQAVTALEQYDYDVQRALNSLLGSR